MATIYETLKRSNWIKGLVLVLALGVTGTERLYASHAAGADLTYRYISPNVYEVTAAFYRDCGGINQPSTIQLKYSSASCNTSVQTVNLPIVNNGPVITYPCNSAQTTCSGGSTPGIQQWIYRANVTLPFACSDWIFSYEVVARNCAITTIVQPSPCNSSTSYEPIYVEALLNSVVAPTNSSPTFSNVPISFVCLGQDFNYNHGVIDVNADSLSYSLITPLTSTNTTITYLAGYSANSPIQSSPAFSINNVTGDLFMHPTALEVSVVAVRVREYRNGVLIGSVIRDMQIYSRNCSPNVVPFATGINGTNNFTAYVCPGSNICFDINSGDTNPGQSVVMSWNSGIPGATFNISGSPFPVGSFCWTPQPSDARDQPYTFTVTVRDDACPLNGIQTYSYSVYVPDMDADIISSDYSGFGVSCNGDSNGSLTASPTGGILPFTYLWNTGDIVETISNLGAGTYTVTITDSKGCSNTFSGSITEPPVLAALMGATTDPTCGLNNGTMTINSSGGSGGNTYLWSDNQSTQTAVTLPPGTYTATVTDSNGCTSDDSGSIQNIGDPYSETIDAAICQGGTYTLPDGSVVTAQGTYVSNLLTSSGCDSIITTNLTVNQVITIDEYPSICDGGSYTLPDGQVVTLAGTYNTLLEGVNACDSLIITHLFVNPVFSNVINASICNGENYMLPDGQMVSQAGNYVVMMSTVNGCDSIITVNLSITPVAIPVITATEPLSFCAGGSVTLTSTVAASYQWYRNGVAIPAAVNQSYVANKTGYYKVKTPTACGDRLSAAKAVVKNPKPVVAVSPSGSNTICAGDSILLTAVVSSPGNMNYQWLRNGNPISGATNATYYARQNGSYRVVVTNSVTGCSNTTGVTRVVLETFTATLTHDIPLITCFDDITLSVVTSAGQGATYVWYKNGNVIPGLSGPSLTTKAPGKYKVMVTNANGCKKITNTLTIIRNCDDVRISGNPVIYPNPSRGEVTVEKYYANETIVAVELLDLTGRVVMQVCANETKIYETEFKFNTESLKPGFYFLRMVENGQPQSFRVVVK